MSLKVLAYGIVAALSLGSLNSFAISGSGNGGDPCEDRFKVIRDDIASWIHQGGSADLKLPPPITANQYSSKMLTEISQAQISCTDNKILIGSVEKSCKNFVDSQGVARIICNRAGFMNDAKEDDQYVLVHHEYAGLAGFEGTTGTESDYTISNQITGSLSDQIVRRLAVKSVQVVPSPSGCDMQGMIKEISTSVRTALITAFKDAGTDFDDESIRITPTNDLSFGAALGLEKLQAILVTFKLKNGTPMILETAGFGPNGEENYFYQGLAYRLELTTNRDPVGNILGHICTATPASSDMGAWKPSIVNAALNVIAPVTTYLPLGNNNYFPNTDARKTSLIVQKNIPVGHSN